MEVRRNTRTAPAVGRQQFAQAEQFSLEPLQRGAAALQQGFAVLDQRRRQSQQFDLQKRLLEEVNAMSDELDQRRLAPDFNPDTFSTEVDALTTDRVNAVTEEYRALGYDADLVDDFFLGMGRVRNQLTETASGFQQQALNTRALSQVGELGAEAGKKVINNIDDYEPTLSLASDTIDSNPYLTPEQRIVEKDRLKQNLPLLAAQSKAMQDPQWVISQLDPQGLYRPKEAAAISSASDAGSAAGPAQDAIRNAAAELGVTPIELAGLASYESAGTLDPSISGGDGGRYVGIFQFGPEEQRKYGVSKNSTFAEQVDALVRFAKDRGYKPGMGWQKLYTTINAGNPNASIRAADSNGTQADHYRNIQNAHFGKAREFLGINSDVAGGGERVPQAGDVVAIDPGASESAVSEFDTSRDLPTEDQVPQALHPVLRDLDAGSRLKLLDQAYAETTKKDASGKAALEVAIANVKAEALANGQTISPVPTREQIIAELGEVAGEQVYSDMTRTIRLGESVKGFAVLTPQQIAAKVEALRPKEGSPTFATDLDIFEAAQKAQEQVLAQREEDPAAYALANFPDVAAAAEKGERYFYPAVDQALRKLGIDPSRVSPLPKAARDNIVRQWLSMTPRDRREFFQKNFLNMGERRFADFTRGAEGTDMDIERKIFAATVGRVSEATMDEIFAGRDAIKKDPARRPAPQALTEHFRKSNFRAVTSMNPDASAAIQDAANALYVQKGGDPAIINGPLYDQALSQALGGSLPFNDAKGAVKDLTILPPGVSAQRFTTWVERLQPGRLSALSAEGTAPLYGDLRTKVMLNDIVDDGVFVMVAPGEYIIRMASDGRPLKTASGRNFIVRLRPGDVK